MCVQVCMYVSVCVRCPLEKGCLAEAWSFTSPEWAVSLAVCVDTAMRGNRPDTIKKCNLSAPRQVV